jgi:hypothetical protein
LIVAVILDREIRGQRALRLNFSAAIISPFQLREPYVTLDSEEKHHT